VRAHCIRQLTSSMRVELVVEDVRLLSVRLSKRIEELNQETAKRMEEIKNEMLRTSMNSTWLGIRRYRIT
jgi:CO dehydrogenase nickel-insertion accessory protein CooC1